MNKKFCYHPWVGLEISPQGEFKPCCKYESPIADNLIDYQNSAELQNLQQDFLNGQLPKKCQRCWNDEDSGLPSKRQLDWEYVFKKQAPQLDKLKVLSLSFGNSCNLACRICNSSASSSWISEGKELQLKFPNIKIYKHQRFYQDKSFIQRIKDLCSEILHVEFPGGEPFLAGVEQHLDFLDYLIERGSDKVSLHYITNTTIFPKQEFWDRWRHFKKVDIQLSIDGIGNGFEYQRWPANWEECYDNILQYIEYRDTKPNIQLSISHTVSIFNVYYLPEFVKWCLQHRLEKPYLGMLTKPKYYNIKVLPDSVKLKITEKLDSFNLENVISYMNKESFSEEFATTVEIIQILDQQRKQSFEQTFSEFYQLLKEQQCLI
jgi:MoaA/NifB/PqqE/SkfB family radical SAM enzyme